VRKLIALLLVVILGSGLAFSQTDDEIRYMKKKKAAFVSSGGTPTHVHLQGTSVTEGSYGVTYTNCSMSLPLTPQVGDLVEVSGNFIYSGTPLSSFVVQDTSGNSYTPTTSTPLSAVVDGDNIIIGKWYFIVGVSPAPSQSINIGWTNGADSAACYADEYGISGASFSFDKDSAGSTTTCSGTSAQTPSITPTHAGSLITGDADDPDNAFSAPSAGSTLGSWTGVAGASDLIYTGGDAEYDLSATGPTAVNYTCIGSGDNYIGLAAAYR
jgi:hypothetical protein